MCWPISHQVLVNCKCSSTIIHWMSHSMLFSLLVILTFKRLRLLRYVTIQKMQFVFYSMVDENEFISLLKYMLYIIFTSSLFEGERLILEKKTNLLLVFIFKHIIIFWAVLDYKELDFCIFLIRKCLFKY